MVCALLLFEDDEKRVAKTSEEVGVCVAYAEAMAKAGVLVGGERLQPAWNAATVRIRGDHREVLDGPYAEAKEQLGGLHLIDVPDLETALAWAARCPSALAGRVEVRPVWKR
jgi:hypothetical protein